MLNVKHCFHTRIRVVGLQRNRQGCRTLAFRCESAGSRFYHFVDPKGNKNVDLNGNNYYFVRA